MPENNIGSVTLSAMSRMGWSDLWCHAVALTAERDMFKDAAETSRQDYTTANIEVERIAESAERYKRERDAALVAGTRVTAELQQLKSDTANMPTTYARLSNDIAKAREERDQCKSVNTHIAMQMASLRREINYLRSDLKDAEDWGQVQRQRAIKAEAELNALRPVRHGLPPSNRTVPSRVVTWSPVVSPAPHPYLGYATAGATRPFTAPTLRPGETITIRTQMTVADPADSHRVGADSEAVKCYDQMVTERNEWRDKARSYRLAYLAGDPVKQGRRWFRFGC